MQSTGSPTQVREPQAAHRAGPYRSDTWLDLSILSDWFGWSFPRPNRFRHTFTTWLEDAGIPARSSTR
jgi:hypothetical protein